MGIFDALTTAVTGLQVQSVALQNLSGNNSNSQTSVYKETDTSFEDLLTAASQSQQVAGSVTTSSRATNGVQGAIQNTSVSTDMAINPVVINGTTITINAGDSPSAVVNDINGQTSATGLTASLNSSNNLVLTSADATTNVDIGSGSTAANLRQLGLSVSTIAATNLITQGAVAPGESWSSPWDQARRSR